MLSQWAAQRTKFAAACRRLAARQGRAVTFVSGMRGGAPGPRQPSAVEAEAFGAFDHDYLPPPPRMLNF